MPTHEAVVVDGAGDQAAEQLKELLDAGRRGRAGRQRRREEAAAGRGGGKGGLCRRRVGGARVRLAGAPEAEARVAQGAGGQRVKLERGAQARAGLVDELDVEGKGPGGQRAKNVVGALQRARTVDADLHVGEARAAAVAAALVARVAAVAAARGGPGGAGGGGSGGGQAAVAQERAHGAKGCGVEVLLPRLKREGAREMAHQVRAPRRQHTARQGGRVCGGKKRE